MSITSLPFDIIKLFNQLLPQSDHISFLSTNSYFSIALGKEWNRSRVDAKFCLERGYKQLSWLHFIPNNNSSKIFWVFDNRESFLNFSKKFLNYPYRTPEAVEYHGKLDAEVLKHIESWLQLENLKYFSLLEGEKLDYDEILDWYEEIVEDEWDEYKEGKIKEKIKEFKLEKMIWMNRKETRIQFSLGKLGSYTSQWLENHRAFNEEDGSRLRKSVLRT